MASLSAGEGAGEMVLQSGIKQPKNKDGVFFLSIPVVKTGLSLSFIDSGF